MTSGISTTIMTSKQSTKKLATKKPSVTKLKITNQKMVTKTQATKRHRATIKTKVSKPCQKPNKNDFARKNFVKTVNSKPTATVAGKNL